MTQPRPHLRLALEAILINRTGSPFLNLELAGTRFGSFAPRLAAWHPTDHQTSILLLIASGRSNKQVARELGLSPFTIRAHVARLFHRYGVHSRTALAVTWLQTPMDAATAERAGMPS